MVFLVYVLLKQAQDLLVYYPVWGRQAHRKRHRPSRIAHVWAAKTGSQDELRKGLCMGTQCSEDTPIFTD